MLAVDESEYMKLRPHMHKGREQRKISKFGSKDTLRLAGRRGNSQTHQRMMIGSGSGEDG